MTKKFLFISMMCLSAMTAFAHPVDQTNDTIYTQKVFTEEDITSTLEPSYLTNVSEAANWGYNWFIEVKGGASAFLGSPIGCGDVFDRITPAIQVGVGKWFTPAIGGRVEFQGLTFKNAEFHKMHYKFIHADFMYNVTSGLQVNDKGLSRWDVIPFVGVGMIHNSDWTSACMCPGHASGSHPFAFSYGVEARFRLSDRVHILGEISGMTTAKNFDCVHPSSKFGDNMLTASVGLSFTIGKAGWKRVVDAKPYIEENVYLKDYIAYMRDENARLQRKLSGD
ncbi:MAG: OmpA family protein, partial [Prevotella sp.]|nr:OmpA family protein [Prevotella sp.]